MEEDMIMVNCKKCGQLISKEEQYGKGCIHCNPGKKGGVK